MTQVRIENPKTWYSNDLFAYSEMKLLVVSSIWLSVTHGL